MSLKVLHTADWHLGQTFFEYDRTFEHQLFFKNLLSILIEKEIDVMLVCGDVFDVSNPSANSIAMFYKFLVEASSFCPNIQIVIIAGNHDSAARLEAPNPILKHLNIHIIGNIERDTDGLINYEKLIIPLYNRNKEKVAWCMAIPFLRLGDFSFVREKNSSYSDGVTELYNEVYKIADKKRNTNQAIIAMGHLHTLNAQITENDKSERLILGGLELVAPSAFNKGIAYTALGHIHRAQIVGGKENIRYSGSPIPMSFSELNYNHRVIVFDIENEKTLNINSVEIPHAVDLLRIPKVHKELSHVLFELNQLESVDINNNRENAPFLEVRIKLNEPEPDLRYKIENSIENKNVRLAKIDIKFHDDKNNDVEDVLTFDQLQELHPVKVFEKIFKSKYNTEIPVELNKLFREVYNGINLNVNEF
jgi:exonuclease SbcD